MRLRVIDCVMLYVVVCCGMLLCLCFCVCGCVLYIFIQVCMYFDSVLSCDSEFMSYVMFVAVVCVVAMNVCGLFG